MTESIAKYELFEQLGRGGFGTVYRAIDTTLGREVAVKVLHPQLMVDENFIERFKKEARTLASLEHPNIVSVYDLGEENGRVFISMQYLSSGALKQRLDEGGKLPFNEALKIMKQVCRGLQAAHKKGLVHRDVKPANILFDGEGQAVVSDFGLARAVQVSGASSSIGAAGTPAYRAPELWRGKPPASPATDVYSLGCVLGEMLTGKELFSGSTPDEIITRHLVDGPVFSDRWPADVPEQAVTALKRALSKDPIERQQNAAEFWKELSELSPANKLASIDRAAQTVDVKQKAQKTTGDLLEVEIAPGVSMQFMRVPAGVFLMGSDSKIDPDTLYYERPQHRIFLDEYWIGKYPVTNHEYQIYVQAAGIHPREYWDAGRFLEGKERHPVVVVSWGDARDFCKWLSLTVGMDIHLPSEAQWEKAARGIDGRVYPWGNQVPNANLCNFNKKIGDTTIVGRYSPGGDSPYGCADMAGNVWEWINDFYDKKYYLENPQKNPPGPKSGENRGLRGGSWRDGTVAIRSASRSGGVPSDAFINLGFRCALSRP